MMHQESPEGIQSLLRKAYGALKPGAAVYVMDMMTDATHTAPKFSTLFAVNMALTTDSGWVFFPLPNWKAGRRLRALWISRFIRCRRRFPIGWQARENRAEGSIY